MPDPAVLSPAVFARLSAFVGHALDAQDPDARERILGEADAYGWRLDLSEDEDGNLLIALGVVSGPVAVVDARNAGLHVVAGELVYLADPLLDDPEPGR